MTLCILIARLNCSKIIIFNNTASFNYIAGISVNEFSYNNSIFRNNITDCYQYGIDVRNSNNINISDCIIEDCMLSIMINDCNNTIILNNTLIGNQGGGIFILSYYTFMNNTIIRRNSMKGCGLMIIASDIHENSFYSRLGRPSR